MINNQNFVAVYGTDGSFWLIEPRYTVPFSIETVNSTLDTVNRFFKVAKALNDLFQSQPWVVFPECYCS